MSESLKSFLIFLGALVIVLCLLGPWLAPGYIFLLDMVWSPEYAVTLHSDGFLNAVPLHVLLYGVSLVMPVWLVQKFVLAGVLGLLLGVMYRCLPLGRMARVLGALLYSLNPFVYARLLAGQWLVLLGYALLPFIVYRGYCWLAEPTKKSALWLGASLALLAMVSIHYWYLATGLFVCGWLGVSVYAGHTKDRSRSWAYLWTGLLALLSMLVLASYWIVPALMREAPLEARFDTAHYEAFAASGSGSVPVGLNLLVLGGFWGEGKSWSYYFSWPQHVPVFWLVALLLGIIVMHGWWRMWQKRPWLAYGLLAFGTLSWTLAWGTGDGYLGLVNQWWFAQVPGWGGLRDSHKLIAGLSLVYAGLFAYGIDSLLKQPQSRFEHALYRLRFTWLPLVVMLPLVFSMYQWWGLAMQANPAWYPDSWHEAKAVLSADARNNTEKNIEKGNILVLPWRGYYSLPFIDQRIVSNPVPGFLHGLPVLAGESVEVGKITDQEVSSAYRDTDVWLRSVAEKSTEEIRHELSKRKIEYLWVVVNDKVINQDAWFISSPGKATTTIMFQPDPLESALLKAFLAVPHQTVIMGDGLLLYRFDT